MEKITIKYAFIAPKQHFQNLALNKELFGSMDTVRARLYIWHHLIRVKVGVATEDDVVTMMM